MQRFDEGSGQISRCWGITIEWMMKVSVAREQAAVLIYIKILGFADLTSTMAGFRR